MDNNKFKVQSVVLPKDKFTLSEAKKKVMDLGYKVWVYRNLKHLIHHINIRKH